MAKNTTVSSSMDASADNAAEIALTRAFEEIDRRCEELENGVDDMPSKMVELGERVIVKAGDSNELISYGHYLKSVGYQQEGMLEEAREELNSAIRFAPSDFLYESLARLFLREGKMERALRAMESYAEKSGDGAYRRRCVNLCTLSPINLWTEYALDKESIQNRYAPDKEILLSGAVHDVFTVASTGGTIVKFTAGSLASVICLMKARPSNPTDEPVEICVGKPLILKGTIDRYSSHAVFLKNCSVYG